MALFLEIPLTAPRRLMILSHNWVDGVVVMDDVGVVIIKRS